jgi:hypothetical protein
MTGGPSIDRATHVYGRGDYGTDYAGELIEKVEAWNCVRGCYHAVGQDPEYGPGGLCHLLANLIAELPIPEFIPHARSIECTARIPVPSDAEIDAAHLEATHASLFDVDGLR